MNVLSKVRSRLSSLVYGHRHRDSDLDDEIRAHLAEQTDALMARGLSERDASAAAKRAFGNVTVLTERSRDEWRWSWIEALKMDVRHAFRLVRRYPAFSVNVILISAVGIAACAATFSLVNGVLLSPLPFAHPDQVYSLELRSSEGESTAALSTSAYLAVAAGSPVLDGIAAGSPSGVTAYWGNEPEQLATQRITPSFFKVFGVVPAHGRPFSASDATEHAPVALLGNALWHARFNGDSTIVGNTIVLDSVAHVIVGVMPPHFRAHFTNEPAIWLPQQISEADGGGGRKFVNAQVRLRDGVTAARAEAWLANVARTRMLSRTSRDSVTAVPVLIPIRDMVYGEVERPLQVLLGAVLMVLLLISANVATMFLARASARDHELGIRRALGAGAKRQVAQLITESLVLVFIGGAIGVAGSFWIVAVVRSLGTRILPRLDAVVFDWHVALFAAMATFCVGALGGLAPAFAARRDNGGPASGTRVTGRRASSTLVTAQIALSVLLLVGAGLLVKGFLRVVPSKPGFASENRTMLMVSLRALHTAGNTRADVSLPFVTAVSERMKQVSDVRDVAAMSFVPFFGTASRVDVRIEGYAAPDKPFTAYQNTVTSNLLDVLEISVRQGRNFRDSDNMSSERVAIVNAAAAERWWPKENAVGKQASFGSTGERTTVTIIGVMSDARLFGSDSRIRPELYLPLAQNPTTFLSFVVHTNARKAPLHELKRAIWSVAPSLPVSNSGELADVAMNSVQRPRFFAWIMGAFALVAVMLSAVAVYGLFTLDVTQRKQEIGIRMALGATGARIGALVLRRAFVLAVIGVVVGAISARGLSRYMESLLVEVTATDASVFSVTIAIALVMASVAACAPAWRAVRVDPVRAVRGD